MNIFLPFPEDVPRSAAVLDDRRLVKQILECKILLDIAVQNRTDGYSRHPVAVHYRTQHNFLSYYGWTCCREYLHRFDRKHAYEPIFEPFGVDETQPDYIPFYAEGSRTDPNSIRTTENVGELFRAKLCRKWQTDRTEPRWTNRTAPEFYRTARKP